MATDNKEEVSLGRYLAGRLREVGCTDVFAVPGDFNLSLLDEMSATPGMKMCWTCNELGAGYAADGYARRRGVAAVVVTFCVGGLSAINACAGAYSEDLPVIFISGGPNSNDYSANHVLHHTIGLPNSYYQQLEAFRQFTCAQVVIQHVSEAHHQIDFAISQALIKNKPAYIEICCNLPTLKHMSFLDPPVPFALAEKHTNKASLEAAVAAAVQAIKGATKPIWLGGPRLRARQRRQAFLEAANATGYPVAMTGDGKGFFPEDHDQYVGIYWGSISTPHVNPLVESADITIAVGTVWTDYSTLGYSVLLKPAHVIDVMPDRVTVQGGRTYGCIDMEDFLLALAAALPHDPKPLATFRRMVPPETAPVVVPAEADAKPPKEGGAAGAATSLTTLGVERAVGAALEGDMTLIAETGDSWFHGVKTRLPAGSHFEIQMRYGSIGWSVGCTLGLSLAAQKDGGRVLAMIGDGSFQMTAQEVSSMLRWGACPIIILLNNSSYVIEEMIHHGESGYNNLQGWDYIGFAKALHNGQGKLWTALVKSEGALRAALSEAKGLPDHLCFIEARLPSDDCSTELLEFGARVSAANSRPPNPQ